MLISSLLGVGIGLTTQGFASESLTESPKFRKFKSIFEPSGVQQLPDGRLIVVEDEQANPLSLITVGADGVMSEQALYRASLFSWIGGRSELDDLEGVTVDKQGYVYAITSHSRKENGKRSLSREQLVRFRVEGNRIVDLKTINDLRGAISKRNKMLQKAAKIRNVKDKGGLNIEALSFDQGKQQLLIGFRSPLVESDAIIMVINNPKAIFEHDAVPKIADELIRLDLNGGGIRALAYVPRLDGFLILSERERKKKSFKLWFWDNNSSHKPRKVKIPDLKSLRSAEGITPVRIDDEEKLLIVSDDGNVLKGKPAHYLLLSYEQLSIE